MLPQFKAMLININYESMSRAGVKKLKPVDRGISFLEFKKGHCLLLFNIYAPQLYVVLKVD